MQIAVALLLLSLSSASVATAQSACSVPGHTVEWIADYCMYKEETDDLIAASTCIELEETRPAEGDECATKVRYKALLCGLHIARGSRNGTVADCVNDPDFSGNIVRNDGAQSP